MTSNAAPAAVLRDQSQWELYPDRVAGCEIATECPPSLFSTEINWNALKKIKLRHVGFGFGGLLLYLFLPDAIKIFFALSALAIGVGALLWQAIGGMNKKVLEEVRSWATEHGLHFVGGKVAFLDGGTKLDPARFKQSMRALNAVGLGSSGVTPLCVEGPVWRAAAGADLMVVGQRAGKSLSLYQTLNIPLAPEVAERYVGVRVSHSTMIIDDLLKTRMKGFRRVEFEQDTKAEGFEVAVREGQDQVALWELFDPTFLTQLADRIASLPKYTSFGAVICDGMLTFWFSKNLLPGIGLERYHDHAQSSHNPNAGDQARMDIFLSICRDIHRRVYAEWQ